MTMTQISYPVAPTTTRLKGTLLDLVTPQAGIGWHDGRGLFESLNCLKFDAGASFCGPNNKDLSANSTWVSGFRFSAYGGITCSAIGQDRDARRTKIRQVFESGESTAIERALMETRFKAGVSFDPDTNQEPDDPSLSGWDAPVDITPTGGAVTPKVGVALLEEFAGNSYVGQPTIHVPRAIGSLLLDSNGAVWDGTALRTNLGAGVAAGVGYSDPNTSPGGASAAAGERWLYATGEVVIQQGDLIQRDEMEYGINHVIALVERPYLVAVDCFTAAIRVTVEE